MTTSVDEPCDGGHAASGDPEILVMPGSHAVAGTAAKILAEGIAAAVERRGRADVATTGGSTPHGVYRALVAAPLAGRVPWHGLHVWLGDDRFVPRADPLSNMRAIDAVLLGQDGHPAMLSPGNVHPWPTDGTFDVVGGPLAGPTACAAAHEVEMRAALPIDAQGRPVFDVVLVGVGADAHVLSLFPGSPAIDATGWTAALAAPTHVAPHVRRVTCTPCVLCATPRLVVVVTGASKAAMVAHVLGADRDVHALPAQLARRAGATWILDEEAAAALP